MRKAMLDPKLNMPSLKVKHPSRKQREFLDAYVKNYGRNKEHAIHITDGGDPDGGAGDPAGADTDSSDENVDRMFEDSSQEEGQEDPRKDHHKCVRCEEVKHVNECYPEWKRSEPTSAFFCEKCWPHEAARIKREEKEQLKARGDDKQEIKNKAAKLKQERAEKKKEQKQKQKKVSHAV